VSYAATLRKPATTARTRNEKIAGTASEEIDADATETGDDDTEITHTWQKEGGEAAPSEAAGRGEGSHDGSSSAVSEISTIDEEDLAEALAATAGQDSKRGAYRKARKTLNRAKRERGFTNCDEG